MSMLMPNAGVTDLHILPGPHLSVLIATTMLMVTPHYTVYVTSFSVNDLESFRITHGAELMKAILETTHCKKNYEIQRLDNGSRKC